jgi:CheY-like chemotaxis protein
LIGVLGISRDITIRKQAEDAMALAARAAEDANRMKSDFLASMSHEIRTPMTAILGYTELLRDGCREACAYGSGEFKNAVHTIQRNAEHLLGLINDILDLSKIEAGKMTVETNTTSVHQILSEVGSVASVKTRAKGLSFDIEAVGLIPRTVQTDSLRLRQILINLIGNSTKFTESGGIRLLVRLVKHESGPCIQFDVIDTGIGMTDEQAARMFRPFTQADTSTARRFGGTGLGLTISRYLAQLLGGDVTLVETKPGLGTRFRVMIATGPLDGVEMTEQWNQEEILAPVRAAPGTTVPGLQATPLKGLHILLAEDGPDNQLLITHILKKAGAVVELAEDGREAMGKASAALRTGVPFDIILMDMQMPEVDGYHATGQLRSQGYTGPIIALTAHAMATERQKCVDAGCNDYATKPIDRPALFETILKYAPVRSA